jgi:hypothetical protein
VCEVPNSQVRIVNTPVLWPLGAGPTQISQSSYGHSGEQTLPNTERVKDQEFFSDFYPSLKALFSKSAGTLYWKGTLVLIDGSRVDVVAIEKSSEGAPLYSITTDCKEPTFAELLAEYGERPFRSARHAILHLQEDMNRAIYQNKKG